MSCGSRPKIAGRHRCEVCFDRTLDIGQRVRNAERRRDLVPEELRRARVPAKHWPPGRRWCAGCQSFVDLSDVRGSRCVPCASAAAHASSIAKTYGLSADQYVALSELQGGRCAICGNRPKKKRLAVDHSHTSGEVRGLLCSKCNHELLGAGYDSAAKLWAAWSYLAAPPTSGLWKPLDQLTPGVIDGGAAVRPSPAISGPGGRQVTAAVNAPEAPARPRRTAVPPLPPGSWSKAAQDAYYRGYWTGLGEVPLTEPAPF